MSVNSQILNIINDIEELNEETSTINGNIETINSDIEGLGNSKQNKIQVTDTIQISKLKTQYVTLSLTGQDLQTTLDGKQIKITDNDYLSISDVNILQTTLDAKQIKITDNDYLSISDVSGLTTALENVQPTDINISDVINLQTTLDGKQNILKAGTNISIDADTNTISASGSGGTSLDGSTDITVANITCDNITANTSSTIQAPIIHATGSLILNKNINETINVLTDKQDTITNITDIGPRQIICNSIIGRNDSVITSDIIRAKDSLNFLKNNVYLNVSTELDSKQIKITENDYLSISDVSGLTAALENTQPTDINISDVINLQTSLNAKQTKITENNFLSISDITGLSDKFKTKQDVITKNDNFIIDSMYVTPLGTKTTINPAQTGELRASILKVEHDTLGLINVAESINTLTTSVNGKQGEILSTSNLTLGTLDANGLITCGDLTINGEGIQTLVDNASGSGLTKSDIDGKQDILTAGTNITINTTTDTTTNITTNTISATGEVKQSDLNKYQLNLSATSLLTIATLNVMSELGVSTISDVPGEITCDSLIVGGTDIDTKIANASSSSDFDAFNVTVSYSGFYRTTSLRTIGLFNTIRVNT